MGKYQWVKNNRRDDLRFTVLHNENGQKTIIALCDNAEAADFVAKACNQFDLEKFEAENDARNI